MRKTKKLPTDQGLQIKRYRVQWHYEKKRVTVLVASAKVKFIVTIPSLAGA